MKCPQCQHDHPPHSRFCRECGTRLALRCAACGRELAADAKFCSQCGKVVGADPPGPPDSSLAESYTPSHLAAKILRSKSGLEGERKQVTVLFADLKGSMELLADRDPEDARKVLDPVLEHMMEAVHHYEGTVNQVMGDGIMALFGAPLAHEDHALRACYAALRMQDSVRRYAEEVRQTTGVPLQVRVGVNSGEVVVRSIGNDLQMDYTAVGQTTHLAARMEQTAMPGSILITPNTLRLAEGYVQVKSLGPISLKGLSGPVDTYELTGMEPTRTRLQAATVRGLTRFIGRDAEFDGLREALDRAGTGHGQVVAIVGEAGVGKSRLVWEFTHSERTRGWLICASGSISYGKATPYLPLIDLLKRHFKIQDRDDHREIREKVTGKLLTLDRVLEPTLPALLGLLDVPVDAAHWQNLDPPQRRQRTLDAIKRLLLRESQVQPLLLVVEDLHWIDRETQAVLDSLVESLPTARLLLLVNYRPEYEHRWASKTFYTQLRLDPLPPESAGALLQALLGEDASLQPIKSLLIERTEGNPFFLEESVRTLVETTLVTGERGAYRLARPLERIQVPATVQAVLAARIDRLPSAEKRLLQSASVIGKDVPFALLQAIALLPEDTLRRHITHLQADEFLYEAKLFPDVEFTFKHALTHEVAYGSLLQKQRRDLHARIGEAIERLYPDRLAEQAERLAHHAGQGEVWEKALIYLRQAGTKAAARSAHREAVAYFEQALVALEHLPSSSDTIAQAIDLRFDLRNSLHPLGGLGQILDHLREAKTLAESLDEQRRLGWVFSYMTQYFRLMGAPDRAIESGQRALAIARALDDFGLKVATNTHLGPAYRALGEYRRAIEILRGNLDSLQGDLIGQRLGLAGLPSVISRTNLVWCLAELGEFAEGIVQGEEGIRVAEAADHPYSLIFAYFSLGSLYLVKGDLQQAIPVLERAFELCRVWNVPVLLPVAASSLGSAYALSGRFGEAIPLLEQAVEQTASMKLMASHPMFLARLAEAYLLAGRIDEATPLSARTLELSRELKERGHEAYALRLLGDIASHQDQDPVDPDHAERYYREAMALAAELGMRPLLARCHLGLGKLSRRTDSRQRAQQQLTMAIVLFRELDMRSFAAQAEAELKALP